MRAIVVEDSAALAGLGIAAAGLLASRIAGTNVPDSIASLLIGVLLAVTAFGVARPLADFLIGRSLPPEQVKDVHALVRENPAVEEVLTLRAVYTGPEEVIVFAKVHPSPQLNIDELSRAMDDLDRKIRARFPLVADVFIDVTNTRADGANKRESRHER